MRRGVPKKEDDDAVFVVVLQLVDGTGELLIDHRSIYRRVSLWPGQNER